MLLPVKVKFESQQLIFLHYDFSINFLRFFIDTTKLRPSQVRHVVTKIVDDLVKNHFDSSYLM